MELTNKQRTTSHAPPATLDSRPPPDAVLPALAEQVAAYRRLAKLAELQHVHVQQGQTEALLDVLSQRQGVLDQIAELEKAIAPAKRQWGEFVGGLDAAGKASAEAMWAEARRLLEQITAADRDDTMVLQQRKLNLGRQITQASAARQVNRTYAAAAYGKRPPGMDVKR